MTRVSVSFLVMLMMPALIAAGLGPVRSMEVVHFPGVNLPPAKSASDKLTDTGATEPAQPLWGHLGTPDGAGPHPALVLMHGCGGIRDTHFRWARHLNKAGYVTLVLDSFGPRSIASVCSRFVRAASQSSRALDAYGALKFLHALPFVDRNNIGVIGWSHGGGSAMAAVSEHGLARKFAHRFRLAIAFYPFCISDRSFGIPVLVLIGSKDDWTPAAYCRDLLAKSAGGGKPIALKVYDGAFHGFDDTDLGSGLFIPGEPGGKHWLQYDRHAHQDAIVQVKRFLGDHMPR